MSEREMGGSIDAPEAEPLYFPVSTTKLVVMTLCTLGLYQVYWFYKNWSMIRKRDASDIWPFWRAVFSIFFCASLFQDIQASAEKRGVPGFSAGGMAAGWIIMTLTWKLPDPFWILTNLAVLFMIPAQRVINDLNRAAAPAHEGNAGFGGWNIFGVVVGGLLFAMSIVGAFIPEAPAIAP